MTTQNRSEQFETATLGGGCFWCLDAVFRQIEGIITVSSGFCGGEEQNPSYELACSGQTGHIEVVNIEYDHQIIDFEQILAIFFAAHDPTQVDGQGYDIGPQYLSVIFYHNDEQKQISEQLMARMDNNGVYDLPIATLLRPIMPYYPAPAGHQDFYQTRRAVPYCQVIIYPKLEKIRKLFSHNLRQDRYKD